MARSAFQGLEGSGRFSAGIDGPWPDGFDYAEVDIFNGGRGGWQDMTMHDTTTGATVAYPPVWLTKRRTAFQSRYALCLPTSTSAPDIPDKGGMCIAFKRGQRVAESGYVAVFYDWTIRGLSEQASPARIKFDTDSQSADDTRRMYGSLQLARWIGTEATGSYSPRWQLRDYGNANGYVDIPNSGPALQTPTTGVGDIMGWNEGKAGFSWAGLVMDYTADAPSHPGNGNYHRAFLGKRWVDISGLANAYEVPQRLNPDNGGTSFALGENHGAAIYNRNTSDATLVGPARLILGAVVKLHYPEGTVFPS